MGARVRAAPCAKMSTCGDPSARADRTQATTRRSQDRIQETAAYRGDAYQGSLVAVNEIAPAETEVRRRLERRSGCPERSEVGARMGRGEEKADPQPAPEEGAELALDERGGPILLVRAAAAARKCRAESAGPTSRSGAPDGNVDHR